MAETTYPFSKASDLSLVGLDDWAEVQAMERLREDLCKLPGFDRINSNNDVVEIVFSDALDGGGEATLAAAVSNFGSLPRLKEQRGEALQVACKTYIHAHYSPERQSSFLALLLQGQALGYVNRVAYVNTGLVWIQTVLAYFYAQSDALTSASTRAELEAVTWDFEQFSAGDPDISLRQALEIVS